MGAGVASDLKIARRCQTHKHLFLTQILVCECPQYSWYIEDLREFVTPRRIHENVLAEYSLTPHDVAAGHQPPTPATQQPGSSGDTASFASTYTRGGARRRGSEPVMEVGGSERPSVELQGLRLCANTIMQDVWQIHSRQNAWGQALLSHPLFPSPPSLPPAGRHLHNRRQSARRHARVPSPLQPGLWPCPREHGPQHY